MGTLTAIFVVLLILIIITIIYLQWRLSYWQRKGVLTLKPHFLLGNAKSMLTCDENIGLSMLRLTDYFRRQNVPFCGYYFFTLPIFVPIKTNLIKKILISDFDHFMDRPFANHESDPLSSHLFALKGLKWKHLRAKLAPAFTKSKNKMMFPTLKACVDNLIDILDRPEAENKPVEMKDLVSRLTIDVLASCAFGLDANTLKNADSDFKYYATAYFSKSLKSTIIRVLTILYPELLYTLKIKSIQDDITNYFLKIVEKTIKYREADNVIRNDFMHLLIQIKNNVDIVDDEMGDIRKIKNQGESLTLSEMAAQCYVFLIGGYESSSSTISFCLYELCVEQSYQEKAREDVVNAIKKNNGIINYDVLSNMTYLEKCIKETIRRYPLLPFLFRTCTKTYQVPDSDVILKKGTTCLISILSLHHDPEMYPNPERFDPERFTEENTAKRHSLSWIPFGSGPRICIAYRFGLMQIKLSLAMLLLNYKFTLNPKTTVPLVMDNRAIQISSKDGIWLDIQKIK